MNEEPLEFIDAWLVDSAACDFGQCDIPGVLEALEPRLTDAWEHNRQAEQQALLQLKQVLFACQESLLQEQDLQLSRQPVTKTEAGILCFQTLSQAVECITEMIERDAAAELLAQCAQAHDPYPTRLVYPDTFTNRLFPQLRAFHLAIDFRTRYMHKRFPSKDTHFKLGGHMQELGCIHIDFTKIEQGWVLDSIWECR